MRRIDSGMMQCFSKGGVCISQSERPSRGWTWEGPETRVFLALSPFLFFTNTNFWRKSILCFQLIKQLSDYQVQTFVLYGWDCGYDLGFFHLCCERDKIFGRMTMSSRIWCPSCCLGGIVIQTDTDLNASYLVLLLWTSLRPEKGGQKECWR